MIKNDRQLGIPATLYRNTKAIIASLPPIEGMFAYATDTGEIGSCNGSVWTWGKPVTNGDSHDHSGGDGAQIAFGSLSGTSVVAILASSNIFTAGQTINVNSTSALVVEQDGVKDNVLVANTTDGYVSVGSNNPAQYTATPATLTVITDLLPMAQIRYTNTAGSGSGMNIRRSRGTEATPLVVQAEDNLGGITWQGYSAASGLFRNAAGITGYVDAEPDTSGDTTDMPGRLQFSTTPDGTASGVVRMIIDNAGLVTVGATKGTGLFNVLGSSDVVQAIVKAHSTQTSNGVEFWSPTALQMAIAGNMRDWILDTTTGTKIGTATTQKLGFWNATPIVQPSGATQAAPAAYVSGAFGLDSAANMQALYDLVVAMRTALVNVGIMKGSA